MTHRRVSLLEDADLAAVDDQEAVLGLDLALEAAVGGVELEEVDHVVEADEGVIDGDDLGAAFQGGAQHQTPDAAESVDSDLRHDAWMLEEGKCGVKTRRRGGTKVGKPRVGVPWLRLLCPFRSACGTCRGKERREGKEGTSGSGRSFRFRFRPRLVIRSSILLCLPLCYVIGKCFESRGELLVFIFKNKDTFKNVIRKWSPTRLSTML